MEDEIEKYREGIERRYGDRRRKNERRYATPKPKIIDAGTIVCIVFLIGFAALLLLK